MRSQTLVDHFGHTSFAVERAGFRILIDPLVVRHDLELRVPGCAEWHRELEGVAAVFISHGHDDHLHPPSLLGLPETVPVHFLDEDLATCSCDESPRDLLTRLGFRDLRPFRPGDRIALAADIVVEAVAAQPSTEGEEQVCFLVETPDVVALDAVDVRDSAATRAALDRRRGEVDVAFVPTGASLQWQGFWNQMDVVEAAEFCRWLAPKRVAACGGSLSLTAKPRRDSLERYPSDRADWLAVAMRALSPDQVLPWRPPFRLHYEGRSLRRWARLDASRRAPARAAARPPAVLAAAFCGYDPLRPTRRIGRSLRDLEGWLAALAPVRDALTSSPRSLLSLLRRCGPAASFLPAALLAPSTLGHLWRLGAADLVARLSALCPAPAREPAELECTFFEVAEALLHEAELPPEAGRQAAACLWVDRSTFRLCGVHQQMQRLATGPEGRAVELREEHVVRLRDTLRQRRPTLGPHQFRLDAADAALSTGAPLAEGQAGLLCFASPASVRRLPLSALECLFLDQCDGRTAAEIVDAVQEALGLPAPEIERVFFDFLARLTRASVTLVDWSLA
jgi:L-ascorbate metabolism protein UlaG (beta-lactamase superfamily)